MTHPAASSLAGFTLVETLVALAVTAILATSGTLLMLQTLRGSEVVNQRVANARTLEATNGLMRADFNRVTRRASRGADDLSPPQGFVGASLRGDGEMFRFVRGGWTDPSETSARSELQLVSYRLENGALVRTAWLRPDPVPGTPRVERIMLDGIVDVDVRYRKSGKWESVWPGNIDGNHPDYVELNIGFGDADNLKLAYSIGPAG